MQLARILNTIYQNVATYVKIGKYLSSLVENIKGTIIFF